MHYFRDEMHHYYKIVTKKEHNQCDYVLYKFSHVAIRSNLFL